MRKWVLGAAAILAVMACIGCGPKSPEQRMDAVLKSTGQTKDSVFPLAGRVTIDGGAPADPDKRHVLTALLFDQDKLDKNEKSSPERAEVDKSGEFQFSHYGIGDGVPPGKYVFAFVMLHDKKKKGLVGPDLLKNLYNDPEKNEKKEGFAIDHKAAKTDYSFDLTVAGKEAATPGPKAVTQLRQ